MSLHGEVLINGEVLIIWTASRKTKEVHEVNEYRVIVYGGYTRWETTMSHRYADGAAVLASKVLAAFAEEEGRNVSDDSIAGPSAPAEEAGREAGGEAADLSGGSRAS